jgi:hypothetical protein
MKLSQEVPLIDRRKLARVATGTAAAGIIQVGSSALFALTAVVPAAEKLAQGMLDVALSLLELVESDGEGDDEDEDDADTEVMERPKRDPRLDVN